MNQAAFFAAVAAAGGGGGSNAITAGLSASSGPPGQLVTLTLTPVSTWAASESVAIAVTGVTGTHSTTPLTPTGSTPATFTFRPDALGTATFTVTPSSMTVSGAPTYTVAYPNAPAGTTRFAIYDPSVTASITLDGSSNVTALADVLGNSNAALGSYGAVGVAVSAGSSPSGTTGLSSAGGGLRSAGGNPGGWMTGLSPSCTLLLVFKLGTSSNGSPFAIGSSGNILTSYVQSDGSIAEVYGSADGGSSAVGGAANLPITTTGLHKWVVRLNSGVLDLFHNTDAKVTGSGTSVTTLNTDVFSLFGAFGGGFRDMTLYGAALYSGAASDADCATLIAQATAKHGTLT